MILERGETREDSVDFAHHTGFFGIGVKVTVPRWEWEVWGKPERVEISVRPLG